MGYHPLSLLLLFDLLNRVCSLWSSNMRLARLPCTTAKGERLGFYELLAIFPRRIFLILPLLPAPIRAERTYVKLLGLALAPLAMLRREEAGRVVLQPGHFLRLPQLQLRLEERLHTFRFDLYGIRNVLILGAQRKNLIKISKALFC